MNVRALCLPTPVAAATVFRALADIEAFPVWAAAYSERLELSLGRWRALTVAGDLPIELEAEERTGGWTCCSGMTGAERVTCRCACSPCPAAARW